MQVIFAFKPNENKYIFHENKYIFFMFPELFYTHFLTRGPLNQISRKFIKVRNGISRNVEINWTKL